ncbi:MAG: outer membrane lipoprotein-sorting protein [Verrucomicrobiota bacterium]
MRAILTVGLGAILASHVWGQERMPEADDVLRTARYVATLKQTSLEGSIRKDGMKPAPVALHLIEGQGIEFQVWDQKVWNKFQLKLDNDGYELFEGVGEQIRKFDEGKVLQPVLGTDLSYEDLAMSFLYWPNGKVTKSERLGMGRESWKVELVNPRAKGLYKTVHVWVHKKSGALLQVHGFRADGSPAKEFKVEKIMNVGGGEYSLKQMKVTSWRSGRVAGITYLEFEKPKAGGPRGLR